MWTSYMYTYIPLSFPSCVPLSPSLSHPSKVAIKHWADLPVLCSCFPLAIYFTFGSVYIYRESEISTELISHFAPAYTSSYPCPKVHSLHVCLYYCPATRFTSTVFLASIYIYVSIRYLFFSFWLTSLCMRDSRSIHLTTNNCIYGWVIFYWVISILFMAE